MTRSGRHPLIRQEAFIVIRQENRSIVSVSTLQELVFRRYSSLPRRAVADHGNDGSGETASKLIFTWRFRWITMDEPPSTAA